MYPMKNKEIINSIISKLIIYLESHSADLLMLFVHYRQSPISKLSILESSHMTEQLVS